MKCRKSGARDGVLASERNPQQPIRGQDLSEYLSPRRTVHVAAELAIPGGLLMAAGPFLRFFEHAEAGGPGLVEAGTGALAVVIAGVLAVVFAVRSLLVRRRYAGLYLPCAAVAAAMTFYCQMLVQNRLSAERFVEMESGLGLQFCYLGALLSLMAAAVSLTRTSPVPVRRRRLAGAAASLMETGFRRTPREVLTYHEALQRQTAGRT